MFCYQCEQTAKGTGCTAFGVCGKSPEVSDLQDLLIHVTKGVSMYAHRARALGVKDPEVDSFVLEALFTTVTNVNFDEERMEWMIRRAEGMREKARNMYEEACNKAGKAPEALAGPATFELGSNRDELIRQGEGLRQRRGPKMGSSSEDHDSSFQSQGSAAYADHAQVLGEKTKSVRRFHAFSIS